MGSPRARSHRAKVNLPIHDQLEDRYKEIGDVFTTVRGHELFIFHYLHRDETMPISNPWSTNIGKLMVPNVFVNTDLLKFLVRQYDTNKGCILLPDGTALVHFAVVTIQEVFAVDLEVNVPFSFVDLEEEYKKMDTTYQGWNLAIHKEEKGRLT